MSDLTPSGPAVPRDGTVPVPVPTQPVTYGGPPAEPPTPAADAHGHSPKKGRRTALIAGAIALVLVGSTVAFAVNRLAPKGSPLDTVVAAEAALYLRLDLDPSAGQKVAAVRFLQKLPTTASEFSKDPRKGMFDLIKRSITDETARAEIDNVEAWLGNRAALVVLAPPSDGAAPVAYGAIEVTDAAKAKTSLDKVTADGEGFYVIRDGYALVMQKESQGQIIAALDKGSITSNGQYAADMAAVGDAGVFSMWLDAGKFADYAEAEFGSSSGLTQSQQQAQVDALRKGARMAMALRFDPEFLEFAGVVRGEGAAELAQLSSGPGGLTQMTSLPDDTLAAMQFNGMDAVLEKQWQIYASAMEETGTSIDDLGDQLGMSLPDDLTNMLGTTTTIALPKQDFSSDVPTLGVITTPKDATKAWDQARNLIQQAGAAGQVDVWNEGGSLYLTTDPAYTSALKSKGALGSTPGFALAVKDAATAQAGFYVDLDGLESAYADSLPAEWKDFVLALRGIGMSSGATAEGSSFSFRLTGN